MFRITTQKSCLEKESIILSFRLFSIFSTGVPSTAANKISHIRKQYSPEAAEILEKQTPGIPGIEI